MKTKITHSVVIIYVKKQIPIYINKLSTTKKYHVCQKIYSISIYMFVIVSSRCPYTD